MHPIAQAAIRQCSQIGDGDLAHAACSRRNASLIFSACAKTGHFLGRVSSFIAVASSYFAQKEFS
jgi:hypothetical protein